MRKFLLLLAGLLTAAGVSLGLIQGAVPAGAATASCANATTTHNGASAKWCGSQEDPTGALMIAAPNKAVAFGPVEVKAASSSNATEDFKWFPINPSGGFPPNQVKVAEYSPKGIPSGLCAAVNNKHTAIVFKSCNQGSLGQQFVPGGTALNGANSWDSEANTNLAITISGGAYSHLTLKNDEGSSNQVFTFTQSQLAPAA
jgi:hypothetical protein